MKVNSLNIAPDKIHFTREFQNGNRCAARKTRRILHQKVGPPATRNIAVQNSTGPNSPQSQATQAIWPNFSHRIDSAIEKAHPFAHETPVNSPSSPHLNSMQRIGFTHQTLFVDTVY